MRGAIDNIPTVTRLGGRWKRVRRCATGRQSSRHSAAGCGKRSAA